MMTERVQTLGRRSSSRGRAHERSRPPDGAEPVPEMLSRLLEAHEIVIAGARKAIDETEQSKGLGHERSPHERYERRPSNERAPGLVRGRAPCRRSGIAARRCAAEATRLDREAETEVAGPAGRAHRRGVRPTRGIER